jgi:hypothetical protein
MQRLATRQSPAAKASERAYIGWIKERGICAACGNDGGVIAHHMYGSSFKIHVGLERVQIGHWAVLGLCQACDNIVTRQSRKAFVAAFGEQSKLWLKQAEEYPIEIPPQIIQGIARCKK